jgi:hypothetical protein
MNIDSTYKQTWYRLIALWVLVEGVLGGLMHAVSIPFTGIVVSSGAVICICLIAYYVPVKGAILKATIIVAIFKMMLGPHTPPTAYVAVFFQGLMGQLLFFNLRFFRISCLLLAVLALVESAIQRILVLTVLYGNNFWNAINEFIRKTTGDKEITNYSLAVATGYIIMHAFIGMIVGVFAGSIVERSQSWRILHKDYIISDDKSSDEMITENTGTPKKRKKRKALIIIWIILTALFLQSWLHIGKPLLPSKIFLQIILRSVFVVLTWYFILSPLLALGIRKWLERRRQRAGDDINEIVSLLPSTKYIFLKSWQLSAKEKGWKRMPVFCQIVLVNTLR